MVSELTAKNAPDVAQLTLTTARPI